MIDFMNSSRHRLPGFCFYVHDIQPHIKLSEVYLDPAESGQL